MLRGPAKTRKSPRIPARSAGIAKLALSPAPSPNTTSGFHREARAVSNGSGGRGAGGVRAIVTRQGRARDRAGAPRPGARAAGAVAARCAAADQPQSGADPDAWFRFSPRRRLAPDGQKRLG